MAPTQTAMGMLITALCVAGLWRQEWLFQNTRKGRRLARWFGEVGGLRVLCGLLVAGALFGILLAADYVRPLQWGR